MITYSDLIFAMLELNISIEVFDKVAYVRRGKTEFSAQPPTADAILAEVQRHINTADIYNYLEQSK